MAQTQVGPGIWRITTLDLDFRGRIFLFNQLRIFRKESSRDFVPTPPGLTCRDAITRLLSDFVDITAHTGP